MRIASFLVSLGLFMLLFTTGTHLSSCTKEVEIHDTVIVRDTIIDKDTVTIIDSSCASCYDLKKGLIAYYNFDGGNLNDSSGLNNHIEFNNATKTTDRFGKSDNAYLFNGTSNYMRVPNSSSLNPNLITMMATIKVNGFYAGPCQGNSILMKGFDDFSSGVYSLRFHDRPGCDQPLNINDEVFSGALTSSSSFQLDSAFIQVNRWYQVVYTYDGTTAKIYVDGQLKGQYAAVVNNPGNTSPLYMGKTENPSFPYWFNGVMDEIRIYNRDLCAAEVKALYKQSTTDK